MPFGIGLIKVILIAVEEPKAMLAAGEIRKYGKKTNTKRTLSAAQWLYAC